MSGKLVGWALDQEIEPPARKLVLVAICDVVSDEPGYETFLGSQEWLAKRVGIKPRQLRNHLRPLATDGYIVEFERRNSAGHQLTNGIRVLAVVDYRRAEQYDVGRFDPSTTSSEIQRQSVATCDRQPVADKTIERKKDSLGPSVMGRTETPQVIPNGFPDTDQFAKAAEYLETMGRADLDLDDLAFRFKAWAEADAMTSTNWPGAWRTWIKSEVEKTKPPTKPDPIEFSDDPVLGKLQRRIFDLLGEATFRAWFREMTVIKAERSCVVIGFPTIFLRDWIETHQRNNVVFAVEQLYPDAKVEIAVMKNVSRETNGKKKVEST